MKKIFYVLLLFILTFTSSNELKAQIVGNPAKTSGVKEWTVSVSGTYFHQGIGTETATATRLFVKSSWGVTPWLDLYLLGGVANLNLKNLNNPLVEDYNDKYRFAYGLGFNTAFGKKIKLWFGANAFRHKTEGNFQEPLLISSQTYIKRFEMAYDWREFKSYLGAIFNYKQFNFYVAGVGWYLWRLEEKQEYLDSANATSYIGMEKGEYLSGLYTGAIIGIEMCFSNSYALTLEALLFNESNVQFFVGISQTGYQSSK